MFKKRQKNQLKRSGNQQSSEISDEPENDDTEQTKSVKK